MDNYYQNSTSTDEVHVVGKPNPGHAFNADGSEEDMVNSPSHYQSYVNGLNIEAIDCMRAAFGDDDVKSFCLCNAMKYLFRCYSKGQDTDILKCKWYLDKFLELGGFDK